VKTADGQAEPLPLKKRRTTIRRYPGWYRHITLAMFALTALAAQTAGDERGAAETDQPSSHSPWQRSGACWTLSCRTPNPIGTDACMP